MSAALAWRLAATLALVAIPVWWAHRTSAHTLFVAWRYVRGAGASRQRTAAGDVMRGLAQLGALPLIVALNARVAAAVAGLGACTLTGSYGFLRWKHLLSAIAIPPPPGLPQSAMIAIYAFYGGAVLLFLGLFFGLLRSVFSFSTTVSIGGVWIGTFALVVVLSVMGGFENDLRQKILGSNAHIQITKEEGDFTEWQEVRTKIAGLPGVVASTPYAVSEVVLAANSNGMNVIIKGIDPATVGQVTELVDDIEGDAADDQAAMKALYPELDVTPNLQVPAAPSAPTAPTKGAVTDQAPTDMPEGGDPLDFSGGAPALPTDPAPAALPSTTPQGAAHEAAHATGHATLPAARRDAALADHAPADPAPADLATNDAEPIDYSQPGSVNPDVIHTLDVPFENTPLVSHRTKLLHGVLVGRELAKQTNLYIGKEVRLVSPLSDPSNPDAMGTPIPFNRDYRVAGIFFTGMYEYDLKYVYVTLDSFAAFLDRGDAVDGVEVRVANVDETDAYIKKLSALLGPAYRVADWKELNRSLFSALKLEKIAMSLILGIVILVASFSILGKLIMVIVEKGGEIALLKTLGTTDQAITAVFMMQGLLIGVVGTMLGLGCGIGTCMLLSRVRAPLSSFEEVYYLNHVPIALDYNAVFTIGLVGVLVSMVATIYPSWIAGRVRPAYGLKQ